MSEQNLPIAKIYRAQMEKLRSNMRIFGGYQIGLGMAFEFNSATIKKMDPRDIKEFILHIRPFVLNNEQINFPKICNLLSRNTSSEKIRETIQAAKTDWRKILSKSVDMILPFEGEPLTPEKNLDLWFNGEFFHLDANKMPRLKKLKSGLSGGFSFMMLLNTLRGLFGVLDAFDKVVIAEVLK